MGCKKLHKCCSICERLAFVNPDNKGTVEQGDFKVQADNLTVQFKVNKTVIV